VHLVFRNPWSAGHSTCARLKELDTMTRTLKAGLAAALSLSAVAAAPASAADLNGWGRGSIKDTVVEQPSAVGPCYFRADAGYSWSNKPNQRWTAFNGTSLSEVVTASDMDSTWTGGVGAGCGTGSRGFRYEFMLGYHGERGLSGMTSPYDDGSGTVASRPITSALTTYTGMVNGYFDLGNMRGMVPYVGLGVGLAYHQMDDYTVASFGNPVYKVKGDNDLTLAWAAMAGVAYQVSDRAILDFGYRYIDFGRASTGRTDNLSFTPSKLSVDDMSAHEFKVGLRYHFGGDSCCSAPRHMPMK
jgi:opacity protein-like surface antigen